MRGILIGLTCLLLLTSLILPARAESQPTDGLSVDVQEGKAFVQISLHLRQNLTTLRRDFSLPVFHALVEGANSSQVAQMVQEAIQSRTPQARVEGLRLEAGSSAWSNSTARQWFNISMSFRVEGITTNTGGGLRVDFSWKSFAVGSSVVLNGVELNKIGSAHLVPVATDLSHLTGTRLVSVAFYVNGFGTSAFRLAEAVLGVVFLDFSRLATPLSGWQFRYEPLSETRSWSLTVKPSLGMYVTRAVTEAGEVETTTYGLFYDLEGRVLIPARSLVNGDMVTIPSELPESLMGVAILSTALVGSGTYFYERRIQNIPARKRSRR